LNNFYIENVHGNSKAAYRYWVQITVGGKFGGDCEDNFKKFFSWFNESYGPSVDIDTVSIIGSADMDWSYQLDKTYRSNHRFFIRTQEQLSNFLLRFSGE
jgi:hypothetical protein